MSPKVKPKPVINYPPVPTRKWKPPARDLPHDPHKKQVFHRQPQYPKTHKLHPSTLGKIWHNYKVIEGSLCILRGDYSQSSQRYLLRSRGMQGPANCVSAIATAYLVDMAKWTNFTIDGILESGNRLFMLNSNSRKLCIQPKDINPIFFIGTIRFKMGIYHDNCTRGRLFREDDKDIGLLDAMGDFFVSGKSCVLEVGPIMVAVWRSSGSYFYFDPGNTDEQGLRCKQSGAACIIKTHDIHDVMVRIVQNISDPRHATFVLTNVEVRNVLLTNLKPPDSLQEYERTLGIQLAEGAVDSSGSPGSPTKKSKSKKKIAEPPEEEEVELELDEEGNPIVYPLEKPRAPSTTYFQILRPDRAGILRASHHQLDPAFSRFGGRQSGAGALAAIATLRIHKARTWTRPLLDGVLCCAEREYADARRRPHGDANVTLQTLAQRIRTEVGTFKANVVDCYLHGRLDGGGPHERTVDLEQALEEFLSDNDAGVINGPVLLAVWIEDERFYMFDPNERDGEGRVVDHERSEFSDNVEKGSACLTWFQRLRDLVDLYLHNVPRDNRRDYFTISKVEVSDYIELPEPWNNFEPLAIQKWILRGTISQNDIVFNQTSRNTQCTVNATVSICYKTIKSPDTWEREDIDKILVAGDQLYNETIQILKDKEKFKDPKLYPAEIPGKFTVFDQEFVIDIDECLVNGMLALPDGHEVPNMKKGLKEFFQNNDSGVVTANQLTVAVWRGEDDYYYFDSHGRGKDGFDDPYGTACVLRFSDLEEVADAIHSNLRSTIPAQYNMYNICRVTASLVQLTETGAKRVQLTHYGQLAETRAMVRAGCHEGTPGKWDVHANRQTFGNLLAALGMQVVFPSALWAPTTLDEILTVGQDVYLKSRAIRMDRMEAAAKEGAEPLEEDFDPNVVTYDTCVKEFMIGINRISVSGPEPVACMVEPLDPTLDMPREEEVEADLRTLLEERFADDEAPSPCIVEAEDLHVCLWRDINYIYLFDPKGRDADGLAICKDRWSIPIYKKIWDGEDEGEYGEEFETFPSLSRFPNRPEMEGEHAEGEDSEFAMARRLYSGLDWSDARACAIAFSTVAELVSHVRTNIPPRKRVIPVMLRSLELHNELVTKVHTNPVRKSEGDWHKFKEIELDRWILRGTMNLEDAMFPQVNRGLQHVAMAVAGALFVQLYTVSAYDTVTVDRILRYGDKMHTVVIRQRRATFLDNKDLEFTEEEMIVILRDEPVGVEALPTHIAVGDSVCRFGTELIIEGDVTSKESDEIPDVHRALAAFFAGSNNKHGILLAKGVAVAFFMFGEKYFMFDPCSRGPSGAREDNGVACYTRFSRLEDLAELMRRNLPKEGINTFRVVAVRRNELEKKPEPADPEPQVQARQEITPFQKVNEMVRILHGSIHQNDPRFGKRLDTMSATNAMVAIGMAHVHKALTWTRPVVDEVLILARRLYDRSTRDLGYAFNPWCDDMTLDMVTRQFKVGTHLVQATLQEGQISGTLYIKDPNVINLRYACEKFFRKNSFGVIESKPLTAAAWRDRCWYFLFDPNPRGKTGQFLNGGYACLLAFKTPIVLAEHFLNNVPVDKRDLDFTITAVDVELTDCGIKKALPPTKTDVLNVKKIEAHELQAAGDLLTGVATTKTDKKPSPKKSHKKSPKKSARKDGVPLGGKMHPKIKSPPKVIPRKHPTYQMPVKPVLGSDPEKCKGIRSPRLPGATKQDSPGKPIKPKCMFSSSTLSADKASTITPVPAQRPSQAAVPRKDEPCTKLEKKYAPQAPDAEQQKLAVRQHVEEKKAKATEALLTKLRQELTPIGDGIKLLRCRISMMSTRYPVDCRGKQALCNASVAVAVARLHPILDWSGANLEVVLDSASALHLESRLVYKDSGEYLSPKHIQRKLHIGKLKLYISLFEPTFHANVEFDTMMAVFPRFFNQETKGIFHSANTYLAIFRTQLHQYLLFEPWPRDINGYSTADGSGCACLLHFPDMAGLVERILQNHEELDPEQQFYLLAIDVETADERDKRKKKEKVKGRKSKATE